jgi:hypothetical protein
MIYMEYNTTENAERDAHAFLDFVVTSIPPGTFTTHTALTLTEEKWR